MLDLLDYILETPLAVHIFTLIIVAFIVISVGLIVLSLICNVISKYLVATAKEIMDYNVEVQDEMNRRKQHKVQPTEPENIQSRDPAETEAI